MTVTPDQVAADLLLDELADRGITVKIHAGNLALWPRDRLTSGLRGRLREHKPELLRALRLTALDEDQRDAWEERVAICMIDGGLCQQEAETIAWQEVERGRTEAARKRPRRSTGREGGKRHRLGLPGGEVATGANRGGPERNVRERGES